jgi:TatD DNase family protein
MYFDSHCHLNDNQLYKDRERLIVEASKALVSHMVIVGYDLKGSKRAIEIAATHKNIWCALGIHPTSKYEFNEESILELEQILKSKKVVALGEIGLDYHWAKNEAEREAQRVFFAKMLTLSKKLNLPVIIHSRDAIDDTLQIIKESGVRQGVIHCYSQGAEYVQPVLDLGFYISFAGVVTFNSAKALQAAVTITPLDRFLIETDAPYLAPAPFRGATNTPANVVLVAKQIALLKNETIETIASASMKNAKKLFNIAD